MRVAIQGDGIAATACNFLLRQAGIRVAMNPVGRARLPVVLLSRSSQTLFEQVFGLSDIFEGLPGVSRRYVKWGSSEPLVLPHSAVVVSECFLLDSIRAKQAAQELPSIDSADWIVEAAPRPSATEHVFGSRRATVIHATLRHDSDIGTCWVESLAEGWMFLIPDGSGGGWLMSVGAAPESQIEESSLIAKQIQNVGEPAGAFSSHPSISLPLSGENRLACGSAAVAFDPLCGDGVGHALREAILASAVIRKAPSQNSDALTAHYTARITGGFRRHLATCLKFYESGGDGPWWQSAAQCLRDGIAWCDDQLRGMNPFRYRLSGLELEELRETNSP